MIDKVIDHLYLSDAGSVIGLRSKRNLSEHQITHVLTISASPINDDKKVEGVSYMFVFALDMLCQDLLGNNLLESTLSFIEDAIEEGGNVLVHCEAGVSRSVTVVAAYLMRKFEWPVEKAILFVQHARPIAGPNPGFMRQLNVFRAMGYRADPETLALAQEYRNWCADSGIIPQTGSLDGVQKLDATQNHRRKFKCRRCREPLFYDTNLMEHAQEARFSADFSGAKCSFGYLITPMEWMKLHNNEEKLWREVRSVHRLGEAMPRRRTSVLQPASDTLDSHTEGQGG
ncbi:hypothetical protein QR680_017848 [Steinernema hermaphroditum]|uniref:protein-tyrosine-phosphatase n=1 Tax=Steinernema hermaphroditum TaxID=289476 RepID=A0AA39LPS6_9BILA|nr:hypothetical protein QR680_017848 [Steinernema hermaphroditum]